MSTISIEDLNDMNEATDIPTEQVVKQVLIAYHAHCIDGFTSAWVAHTALTKKGYVVELLDMEYTEASTKTLFNCLRSSTKAEPSYDELYVVDFSLKLQVLLEISVTHPKLRTTILDHHKTAFESYVPYLNVTPYLSWTGEVNGARVILDMAECGASLCWSHFNPGEPLPTLIAYVKDWDLWQFVHGDKTKWVHQYLIQAPKRNIQVWEHINRQFSHVDSTDYILNEGKHLQECHDKEVDRVVEKAVAYNLKGYLGLVVECKDKTLVSDVGHSLANTSGYFGLMYSIDLQLNQVTYSLRSCEDFDVSVIAKSYGGGGHKNAAGFTLPLIPGARKELA